MGTGPAIIADHLPSIGINGTEEIVMSDYRDNFDMHPNSRPFYGNEGAGFAGPLMALVILLVMIVGVFVFSGSTGSIDGTLSTASTTPATSTAYPAAE